jgi:hypothetical protein
MAEPTTITPAITGQGITPQMPTEPTAEAKAMTFTMNPELLGKDASDSRVLIDKVEVKTEEAPIKVEAGTQTSDSTIKKEEPKKVEAKPTEKKSVLVAPVEDKKTEELKGKSAEPKKEVVKTIAPKTEQNDQFDYAKYAPQEVVNMKNMSRPSREAYAKLIDENKQLSSLKDATYLQHEQGYTLSPEYQETVQKQHSARIEGKAWENALLNIQSGKPYRNIVGFDQQGNARLGPEIQPVDGDGAAYRII